MKKTPLNFMTIFSIHTVQMFIKISVGMREKRNSKAIRVPIIICLWQFGILLHL